MNLRRRGVVAMAYSPFELGDLPNTPVLAQIAKRRFATAFQIALAWLPRQPGLIAIPKAASLAHVARNAEAAEIVLTADLAAIDAESPPPSRKTPLDML